MIGTETDRAVAISYGIHYAQYIVDFQLSRCGRTSSPATVPPVRVKSQVVNGFLGSVHGRGEAQWRSPIPGLSSSGSQLAATTRSSPVTCRKFTRVTSCCLSTPRACIFSFLCSDDPGSSRSPRTCRLNWPKMYMVWSEAVAHQLR